MMLDQIEASEIGLLSAMMFHPPAIDHIEVTVMASDFLCPHRGRLFGLLCDMHAAGESIRDTSLVLSRIKSAKLLAWLGGAAGFTKYTDGSRAANAEVYALEVRQHAMQRATKSLADRLQDRIGDHPAGVIAWMRSELDFIESRLSVDSHTSTIGEACRDLYERIKESRTSNKTPGIATGIDHLDSTYGGLHPSRLYVFAGRPGGGKTSIAQQIGENIAASNDAALFVSLEMSRTEIASRYLSRATRINGKYIAAHTVTDENMIDIVQCMSDAADVPFIISEPRARNSTLAAICAEVRKRKATDGISVAIIDYLQILEPAHARETEYERFTAATRAFKQLARDLEIPVVLLSQLNRGSEKDKPREPRLSDLRGTGAIEQDADGVILLYPSEGDQVDLIVPKMRGGERSRVTLQFESELCNFKTLPIEAHPEYHSEFGDWQ